MSQSNLHTAKMQKKDEFYTQFDDIANELRHYKDQFKGKIVYCNCDDPYESNFFKYFAANFNHLGLKKLITTVYDGSPVANQQMRFGDMAGIQPNKKEPLKIEINEVPDLNKDGAIDLADVERVLSQDKNSSTPLAKDGHGDFRSEECIELLKQADIVCTNPPFSLFREYVAQLMEYDKKFLIIGTKHAIIYKDIFKFIKQNKLWLGHKFANGNAFFTTPYANDSYASGVFNRETGLVKFRNVGWFTNLDYEERHDDLQLYRSYKPELYPKYDNYEAVEVAKISEIPKDFEGVMGVPVTFLDSYNPEQFEIIGSNRGVGQDTNGIYGRGTMLNGKETFKQLFIKNKKVEK
jgi:hypothetical protein